MDTCPLCLEDIETQSQISWHWRCSHSAHLLCVRAQRAVELRPPCPVCRMDWGYDGCTRFAMTCSANSVPVSAESSAWNAHRVFGVMDTPEDAQPACPNDIVVLCCERVVSAGDGTFRLTADRRMRHFPVRESGGWQHCWKCFSCGDMIRCANLRLPSRIEMCFDHGVRALVIDNRHESLPYTWACVVDVPGDGVAFAGVICPESNFISQPSSPMHVDGDGGLVDDNGRVHGGDDGDDAV